MHRRSCPVHTSRYFHTGRLKNLVNATVNIEEKVLHTLSDPPDPSTLSLQMIPLCICSIHLTFNKHTRATITDTICAFMYARNGVNHLSQAFRTCDATCSVCSTIIKNVHLHTCRHPTLCK